MVTILASIHETRDDRHDEFSLTVTLRRMTHLVEVMADREALGSICFSYQVYGEPELQVLVSITSPEPNLSLVPTHLITSNSALRRFYFPVLIKVVFINYKSELVTTCLKIFQ